MSKVLIWSDGHIHPHKKRFERLQDCLTALEWVFTTAKNRGIKDIIFAGDLFQDREKIDVATYSLTFDIFLKYCDGSINLWLLLGNHDLWYYDKWDINSILPFSALPNVTVVNTACTLEIDGKEIDFLPYIRNPIDCLAELENKNRKGYKVLVAHLAIHGAELNTLYHTLADEVLEHDGEMTKIGPELFQYWDKVFLGHYHGAQKIENLEYIGSPLQLNFGEAFQQKHIIVYNLEDGDTEYVVNDFSPQHLIINESEIEKYDVKRNFVRLIVDNAKSIEMLDLRKSIQEKSPGTLEVLQKPKKAQNQVVQDAKAILNKEDEMLEMFVKETDTGEMEKKHLLEVGNVCITSIAI